MKRSRLFGIIFWGEGGEKLWNQYTKSSFFILKRSTCIPLVVNNSSGNYQKYSLGDIFFVFRQHRGDVPDQWLQLLGQHHCVRSVQLYPERAVLLLQRQLPHAVQLPHCRGDHVLWGRVWRCKYIEIRFYFLCCYFVPVLIFFFICIFIDCP